MITKKIIKSVAMSIALSIVAVSPAAAQVDFTDKTITIVVPFGEGGGTSQVFGFSNPICKNIYPDNR